MKDISCTNKMIADKIREVNPYENVKYQNSDDISNGLLFADVFGDIAKFNTTAKQWYVYDGLVWKEDTGGLIVEGLAQRFQRALYIYAADKTPNYQKTVTRLGSRNPRNTMIQDARYYHAINSDSLDANKNLLNCKNCVIDLNTFEVLEHDSKLLLSKITNVTYNPEASSELFNTFIDEIMLSKQSVIDYLQRLHGYYMTAESNREECYLYYGATTRNGKSTLLETYSYMLGDYALNMQPESLAETKRDSRTASGDIARLKGCRFLHVSEPKKRMIFDVALLKTLLGRDKITARHLHEREFEFYPEFKLCLNSNYLPVVNDDTLFSSGRIKVIPFERHFEDSEQDKTLKDKLKSEDNISGIFNWAFEGLKKYREYGLSIPEEVRHATDKYREESDKMKQFMNERLEVCSTNIIEAKNLYKVYTEWCDSNGYGCENKKNFFEELKGKNLLQDHGTINHATVRNVVKGYRIV